MLSFAPIILFAYNRPKHTEQTLIALKNNVLASESILYIFIDGAKKDSDAENIEKNRKVSEIAKSQKWCKEVYIIEREKNFGLAENVINGVTDIVNKHGKIIVLEDDLITSPHFLEYCNEGLEMYKNHSNIYSINAYQFDLNTDKTDTFLCPLATSSWGWATWADRWNIFDRNPSQKKIIQNNIHIRKRFNLSDYDYATMLDNQKSWAIRWYYSVFIRNGLGLFPTKSLVSNIGFDGSGENCGTLNINQNIYQKKIKLSEKTEVNAELYAQLLEYFTLKNNSIPSESSSYNFSSLIKKTVKILCPPIILNLFIEIRLIIKKITQKTRV
jgi:hypothetical protein